MRSSVPIPGNPWPHDMTLTIEDNSNPLLELLWIREAWDLQPVGDDLPPLLSDSSVGAQIESGSLVEIAQWRDGWPVVWEACIQHASQIQDVRLFDELLTTSNGSTERLELLARIAGPYWRDTFGDFALTDRYGAWAMARCEAHSRHNSRPLEEEPERVSLAALIPAWESGLTKIVVIPCRGDYTRIIGEHSLLVTAETRDDPERYSEALARFR